MIEQTKQCKRCGQARAISDFAKSRIYRDSYCRVCRREYGRENDRRRVESGLATRRKAWDARNIERKRMMQRAADAVWRATHSGRLVRPTTCERCGSEGVFCEAAHHDYSKPLEVDWLCRPCHVQWDHADPKTVTATPDAA